MTGANGWSANQVILSCDLRFLVAQKLRRNAYLHVATEGRDTDPALRAVRRRSAQRRIAALARNEPFDADHITFSREHANRLDAGSAIRTGSKVVAITGLAWQIRSASRLLGDGNATGKLTEDTRCACCVNGANALSRVDHVGGRFLELPLVLIGAASFHRRLGPQLDLTADLILNHAVMLSPYNTGTRYEREAEYKRKGHKMFSH
jgi:hypothetical protein